MGMFDTIQCDATLPDDCAVPDRSFQTKTLCCIGDRFTITAQGRLILHRVRYRMIGKGDDAIASPYPVGDIDTEYHGDIELYGIGENGQPVQAAARFTHGTLEWIRRLDALGELHRNLLTNRP